MDERWAGAIEERIGHMPKRADLDEVRSHALMEIEKLGLRIDRALEKHEAATKEAIRTEVTKTVEAAFNLQWAKIEAQIATRMPATPKRDWMPIAIIGAMALMMGFEEGVPFLMKLF